MLIHGNQSFMTKDPYDISQILKEYNGVKIGNKYMVVGSNAEITFVTSPLDEPIYNTIVIAISVGFGDDYERYITVYTDDDETFSI